MRQRQFQLNSFLSSTHCRAASTVMPLPPKATFTLSIPPNLGLARIRAPLTSAIDTILAIGYSSNTLHVIFSRSRANSRLYSSKHRGFLSTSET